MLVLKLYDERHAAGLIETAEGNLEWTYQKEKGVFARGPSTRTAEGVAIDEKTMAKGRVVVKGEYGETLYRRANQQFDTYEQIEAFLTQKQEAFLKRRDKISRKVIQRSLTPDIAEKILKARPSSTFFEPIELVFRMALLETVKSTVNPKRVTLSQRKRAAKQLAALAN